MANVIINDTNLTNIANAIREKNGETTSYKPSEMAAAIAAIEGGGGGYVPTDADLRYKAGSVSPFSGGANAWILKEYGDRIYFETMNASSGSYFDSYPYDEFTANITVDNNYVSVVQLNNLFNGSTVKNITGSFFTAGENQINVRGCQQMFAYCNYLRSINDEFIDGHFIWANASGTSNGRFSLSFSDCYSLREVPKFFMDMMNNASGGPMTNNANYTYNTLFKDCYTLNKIENLPVIVSMVNGSNLTANMFNATFYNCHNISKFTFATDYPNKPKTAKWTNQTIDLSQGFGYCTSADTNMTGYNSGLINDNRFSSVFLPDKQYYVGDGINTYWSAGMNCAKYGHTEAVETINSLPDTSAAGGNNTIIFQGSQGGCTDYLKGKATNSGTGISRISLLSDAEIAVATAKGWTVSIV